MAAEPAADDSWRTQAAQRIAEHRVVKPTITVHDAAGQPLADLPVTLHMTNPDFNWGTAVPAFLWGSDTPLQQNRTPEQLERYRLEIKRLFNCVVFANAYKWNPWNERHLSKRLAHKHSRGLRKIIYGSAGTA